MMDFVAPMLAKPGRPFDSEEHFFEIKWDGTRALAYVDSAGMRLRGPVFLGSVPAQ